MLFNFEYSHTDRYFQGFTLLKKSLSLKREFLKIDPSHYVYKFTCTVVDKKNATLVVIPTHIIVEK